jgi:hypothetical protein
MNKLNNIKSLIGLSLSILLLSGCKKDFLERPPTDAVVDANFYQNDDQILAATSAL